MFLFKRRDDGNILDVERQEQYHTVEQLIKRSKPTSVYYTLLLLSSVIISAGLLLNNSTIVIGGMLVTPVMTPILLFSLGISILEFKAMRRAGFLMIVSFLIIVAISWIMAKILGVGKIDFILSDDPQRTLILYFIVAFSSGIAATLAWSRKELSDVLPGIAISVSLVPPLALIGIFLSITESGLLDLYIWVFFLNLVGMVSGSFIIYSLLKFYQARGELEKNIDS